MCFPVSICMVCKHRENHIGMACAAFPAGISEDILRMRADHRYPYPGGGGVRFDAIDIRPRTGNRSMEIESEETKRRVRRVIEDLTEMDWSRLSFPEQLGNIGAEISRASYWDEKGNVASRDKCLERVLDLVVATLDCNRGHFSRLREVARLGEVVAGVYAGTDHPAFSLKLLEEYCLHFAILAREGKG